MASASGAGSSSVMASEQIVISSTFWIAVPDQPQCEPDHAQCFKLLRELNGQVSSYHQLATALGTASGDGQFLRSRLKCTRRRARQVASLLRRMIISMDNQESTGRLWCLLYSCLYVLALDMQRTLKLQQTFALHSAAGFINTGLVHAIQHPTSNHHHPVVHHHHHHHHHSNKHNHDSSTADANDDVPLADRLSLERAEINQLQQEIEELDGALLELRTTHNLAELDSYEPDELPLEEPCRHHHHQHHHCEHERIDGGEGDSIGSWPRKSSADVSDSEENEEDELDSNGSAIKQRRCLCVFIGIVIVVFVLAAVLGASLAFQHPLAH